MKFAVGVKWPASPARVALLTADNWDDWFRFETTLILKIRSADGSIARIGALKMGESPMPGRSALLPERFDQLGEQYFSLGQDESYYEALNELGDGLRDEVLKGLNDVAANLGRFEKALDEPVMGRSLLRFVSPATVRGQFHRMTQGGARLSPYSIVYTAPKTRGVTHDPIQLAFTVQPESVPPTNVHVLIGRNGVGKTHLLNGMARAVFQSDGSAGESKNGKFDVESGPELMADTFGFANLVSVTFSAFDPFLPLPERQDKTKGVRYAYIGLKRKPMGGGQHKVLPPKSPNSLATEFANSMLVCQQGPRRARWHRALRMLESDPVFQDVGISELADDPNDDEELGKLAKSYFNRLSSGHKIVLLSITRLVETVEERTLVLLDEPEAHLHPPLLAAFVRSLSDLLINRNGVAVIATHSPVILQEVPRSCVWLMRRSGMRVDVDRPSLETFGENVGILTREVFGLEVTDSGFNTMLREAADKADTYDDAVAGFSGQLGGEALAILQAYFAQRD